MSGLAYLIDRETGLTRGITRADGPLIPIKVGELFEASGIIASALKRQKDMQDLIERQAAMLKRLEWSERSMEADECPICHASCYPTVIHAPTCALAALIADGGSDAN